MLGYVGPMLGYVGLILGLCWAYGGLCWPMLSYLGSPLLESMVAMLGISPNCL